MNTWPKMKNCEEYTMSCIHCLVRGIVLEISHKIVEKNQTQGSSKRKPTIMSRKNTRLNNK